MIVAQINGDSREIIQKWLDSVNILVFESKGFLDKTDGDI